MFILGCLFTKITTKNQLRRIIDTLDKVIVFFIKDIELLTKTWECAGCRQRFNRHDNYNRHVTGGTCGGGKTKLICPGEKFERIMNSTEKVFYGGNKKFSYAACQWIEKQSELTGRHIHPRIMRARWGKLCAPVCGKREKFSREGNTGG